MYLFDLISQQKKSHKSVYHTLPPASEKQNVINSEDASMYIYMQYDSIGADIGRPRAGAGVQQSGQPAEQPIVTSAPPLPQG